MDRKTRLEERDTPIRPRSLDLSGQYFADYGAVSLTQQGCSHTVSHTQYKKDTRRPTMLLSEAQSRVTDADSEDPAVPSERRYC